jgi:P4 family phage/plasmid primase-like protien
VLLNLDALVHIEETVELGTWLDGTARAHAIPMRNGLLSLEGFQEGRPPTLLEHTPGYFTLTCLPFNYEPDAKCIAWLTFLREALNGSEEYVALFQEWLGYLFRPDLQLQKFMLISGDGATGKTTALTVVEALLGKDNVSHIPLSRFGQRFALAAMAGKVANITSESSHLVEEEGENMLKAVVSGDAVEVERKYQEAFTMTPTAKIMIACNTLPRFSDKTQGVWRRVLLFPFDHVVPEDRQVRGLAESIIEEELAGVFIWALDGLRQLNRNRRFTIPAASVAMTEQYRRESDSARAFLIDNYIYSPNGAGQLCEEVYAAYRRWCETNGCQPISQLHFGRSVHRVFPDAERVRPGGSGRRPWVYRGLVASQESGVWSQQS